WLNRQKLAQDLDVLAEILGNRSLAALQFSDAESARRNLDAARFDRYIEGVCLFQANGELLASYARDATRFRCDEHQPDQRERLASIHMQRTQHLALHDDPVGAIVVVAHRRKIVDSVYIFLPFALALITGVFLLAVTIVGRMLRTSVRP